ncbi:MAG: hypothetical protein U0637_04140 [Phycisphaerales bacterium]
MLRARSLVLVLAAGSTLPLSAYATVLNYASAVNGAASTAGRWSPAQVPVGGDDLVFNATAGVQAYAVTFDASTATSRTMSFQEDTVTLTMSAAHTTTNGVAVGDLAGDVSTVTLSSGAWNSGPSGFVNIGDASGATGTFNVTGSGAHFGVLGTSDLFVGNNGAGTLNITGTGDVTCNDLIHIGQGSAGVGGLTVSGFSAVVPFGSSQLFVNGAGESRWGNGGDATVSIANGGQANFAGSLVVANLATSFATVTVGGAGLITGATVDVGGDLSVGRNTTAGLAPGTGTVTVNSDGRVLVGGTLHVGDDPDGGSGTLNLNSGSLVDAVSVVDGVNGVINHSGGTLRINGGAFTGFPAPLTVSGTGGPTLQFSGGLSQALTAVGGVGLRVGDDLGVGTFTGSLLIDAGADLVMSGLNNDINIGDDAGTSGLVTVTGAGSRLVDDQVGDLIRVGVSGAGELRVEGGGQVLAREIQVPASSLNGSGMLITGATGAPVITTVNLAVGNAAGLGGGLVTINPFGVLNATDPGTSVVIRDTGAIGIAMDAVLNAAGTVLVSGGEFKVGGACHAGTLVDVSSGTLRSLSSTAGGLVDAPVHVRSGAVVEVVNGDLSMGQAAVPGAVAFDAGSTLAVGSGRTCTLLNATLGIDVQMQGVLDMQGGTLVCNALVDMASAPVSNLITGFGTVDSDIRTRNNQTCTPAGAGLVFQRHVTLNSGFNANGTAIRFGPTSTLSEFGSHTMNCKVTADAGSVMMPAAGNTAAFGPITMGDGSATGVTLNGVIHMGTNGSLTLNDTFSANLGTLTDMNGGSITNNTGLALLSGRVLRGHGSLSVGNVSGAGLQVNPGGIIDPDAYFSGTDTYHGVGTFFVDGRYIQVAGGIYLCEVAGFNSEFQPLNDRIEAGPVTLGGTLDVSLIDGYVPQQCHEFTILTYTSRSGAWSNIIQPPGASVGVRYEATRAVLFFNSVGCDDIDYNNDGLFPDTSDIDDFLSVFSGGSCSTGACSDIDFNNDCLFPDTADIDTLLLVFSGGPCS